VASRGKMKRIAVFMIMACVVSAAPIVCAQEIDAKLQRQMFPGASDFVIANKGRGLVYYRALDKNKKLIGAVFCASGQGYNGAIKVAAGMNLAGEIMAIKIIEHKEDAGSGGQVAQELFLNQFLNKGPDDFDSIQAISGATISSRAVVEIVKSRAKEILKDLQ
jgi:Na+-translocating ferredoxin:NAD+ oxidoreductase RnfG subunit